MGRIIHVILSGGVGSRLWPVSRKSMPKQYIPLFGNKSLFQLTAERNKGVADHVMVVGNKDNYLLSQSDLMRAGIADYSEIIEAAPRNTAAAIAFAAMAAAPDDILLVTPSDHIITPGIVEATSGLAFRGDAAADTYTQALQEAIALAREGHLVTFGVVPTKPETGYGYIEFEGADVLSFREKPDAATAEGFASSGRFLWNSGMFCFQAAQYLCELTRFEPNLQAAAQKCYQRRQDNFMPNRETMQIPSKSIDYAVMERSKKIKVVKADFGWSDLGSFESIWEHWTAQGEVQHFRDNNCVVGSNKHVEFLGVENVVLVETPDAILILDKARSQEVKKIYERLEREKPELVG